MGLFNRNSKETNFAGGSKNVMESIQRDHDTNTLIYLDPREDFNTESIITVAPNEQVIFINGIIPFNLVTPLLLRRSKNEKSSFQRRSFLLDVQKIGIYILKFELNFVPVPWS